MTLTSPQSAQTTHYNAHIAWIVLLGGLTITAVVTQYMKSSVERIAGQEFVSQCNEIQNRIDERLDDHARILQSGAALFNASEIVTREEWHLFTHHQKIEKQLPGIQGIGFSLLIPREELTRHIRKIRREGFPEYKLRPDGDRGVYSSIIYLEPFSGRNLRAFGYDMLSEPVRRAAMERARDTGDAALSGKVILVQETEKEVQAGTLMYFPVYRKGMPIETVEQRRAALYGWVYSPYRMKDLMQGIFGGRNPETEKQLHLQVFDGKQPSPQSLLYESRPAEDQKPRLEARFTRQVPVDFNSYFWTLRFTQSNGGFLTVDYISVWLTMISGMLITLLFFALIRALLNTHIKAQQIAENLTTEVTRLANKQLLILSTMPIGASFIKERRVQLANQAHDKIFGYEIGETLGMSTAEFFSNSETYERVGKDGYESIANGGIYALESEMKKKDGSLFWCSMVARAVSEGKPEDGSIWMFQDITEHKQAEAALRESEERYRIAIEASSDGIAIVQNDVHAYVNRAFLNMFRYNALDEIIGQERYCIIHPDDYERVIGYAQARKRGEYAPTRYEFKGIRRDGVPIDIEVSVNTISYKGEEAILAYLRDITERKRAEEALHESATLQRILLANLPAGVIIVDPVTRMIESVNNAAATIFGIQAEHIVGHRCHAFLCPASEGACPVCDLDKEVDNAEREMICADGSRHPVLKSVKRVQIQGQEKLLECFVDITDRKRAEELLRDSEEKYRLLIENSHDIIYTLNTDGVFTFVSPAWTEFLGHPLAQVAGQPFQQFVHPDDLPGCLVFLQAAIETGQRQEGIEYRVRHVDGSWYWHTSSAVPLRDEAGTVVGFEGTARDITEHKRLEEERRHREKLESALEMAGTICHELNQPMQIISGYVDLLSMSTSEDSQIGTKLNAMKGQIHRMEVVSKKLMSLEHYTTHDYVGIGKIINIHEAFEEKNE